MRHHSTVRHRSEGFELRCETCGEYWPLTLEFWSPPHGMTRCKGCRRTDARHRMSEYRRTPRGKAYQQDYTKNYRPAKRRALRSDPVIGDEIRAYNREWMRRWREKKAA